MTARRWGHVGVNQHDQPHAEDLGHHTHPPRSSDTSQL
jgi:hypothetical protein